MSFLLYLSVCLSPLVYIDFDIWSVKLKPYDSVTKTKNEPVLKKRGCCNLSTDFHGTKHVFCHTLTTAGEGMWMMDTERGLIWLTSWHRTVPFDKASPRSSGSVILSRDSRVWGTQETKFLQWRASGPPGYVLKTVLHISLLRIFCLQ